MFESFKNFFRSKETEKEKDRQRILEALKDLEEQKRNIEMWMESRDARVPADVQRLDQLNKRIAELKKSLSEDSEADNLKEK